ncbi:MAG: type II toxin-antitoxin system PemK/MazF family toxin [Candidatus Pacebacteria bacterium]|nr:type II toxin-antitoxin system PemK/MazF family toxin [Candidatus Paceibacterota bacterium]
MEKDFDGWNEGKKRIDRTLVGPGFREREIWYCRMGLNVGFEQDGKGDDFLRPVLIVRKFNNRIFWAIPLTSAQKHISEHARAYYFAFSFLGSTPSVAILSQLRLLDSKRLSHLIGRMAQDDFISLKEQLRGLIP